MPEHSVATGFDVTYLERVSETPSIRDNFRAEQTNNVGYSWEKEGVNPGKLLHNTYLNPHTGRNTSLPESTMFNRDVR
jgi:hypothetical protein